MPSGSDQYLTTLHEQIDERFSLGEIEQMGLRLGFDLENIRGETRSAKVQNLILALAKRNRLQELVDLARRERSGFDDWQDVPDNLALPESPDPGHSGRPATFTLNQTGQTVQGPQFVSAGEMNIGQVGDTINTGGGAYIVQQFQQAPATPEKPRLRFEPVTVEIAAASFSMGSDPAEGIPAYETPRHTVEVPAFKMSKMPVTNSQYHAFLQHTNQSAPSELRWGDGTSPSSEQENAPVTGVTWHEAIEYCRWLSGESGRAYTLPSEAQWEYAAQLPGEPFDLANGIREWMTTLWGSSRRMPDSRYRYPWRPNDGRDDVLANDMIRRVVRGGMARITQRSSELPEGRGLAGNRIGFRVIESL